MRYSLRSMSLGEVLDTGWKLYVENFLLFVSFNLVVGVPAAFFSYWMLEYAAESDSLASLLITMLAYLVVILVASPLAGAATTRAIASRYLDERIGFGAAWSQALRLLLPLLGAMLLGGLLVIGGMFLLVVPGIYLMLRFSLMSQAVMVEGVGGRAALKRSAALMKGNYGRVLAIYLMMWVVQFALGFLSALLALENPLLLQLLQAVLSAVTGAFVACALTVAYFERRCTHEGFDLERLAGSLGVPRPVPA